MTARRGQAILYLVLVLVVLALLMVMNVGAFLAVRSKNRLMNAVDAAAIAVAKHQGELLNELGRMNVRHLRSLVDPRIEWTEADVARMRELAVFGPLDGIPRANAAAADWGYPEPREDDDVARCLRSHVREIVDEYCTAPDLYPEYRDGQWADYAARLSALLSGGLVVAPGFLETANAWSQDPLLSLAFYDAIAARAWCWFGIGNRSRYFDMDHQTMPRPVGQEAKVQENSEVYSIHVTFKTWLESRWAEEYTPGAGFSERWTNFVCQVSGCTREELAASPRAGDPSEVWAFYDDYWGRWSRTFTPDEYPIAGGVKPEYDVAGCVASCLMVGDVQRLVGRNDEVSSRAMEVTAEAKPLGTVVDLDGAVAPVTAYDFFIAPSRPGERIFTEAQLVLMHAVPRAPGVSLSPAWYDHVKDHLPRYFEHGPTANGCFYCRQLVLWEDPAFRAAARNWLTANGDSCRSGSGPGTERGGYDWAH